MPLYTYHCEQCGREFNQRQTFLSLPLQRCPACAAEALRRVPQLPTVVFTGHGWYSTDHRPPPPPPPRRPEQRNGLAGAAHDRKSRR